MSKVVKDTIVFEDEMTYEEYRSYILGCITRAEDRVIYGWSVLEPEKKKPNWDAVPQSVKEINDSIRVKYGYAPRWSK